MENLYKDDNIVSPKEFYKLWKAAFANCSIRKTKNVGGKCKTCADLGDLRASMKSVKAREEIRALCYCHRTMFMGERQEYYRRRNEAICNPDKCMSIISDGMAQCHCLLPWYGI
jgi:hypothetical protein